MSSPNVVPERSANLLETQKFQSQIGHISRHSSVFFAGTIFRLGTGYLFKVYLARALGAEPLGVYALGMTIIGFVGIFNGLGLPQAAVRFVALYKASNKMEQLRDFLLSATGIILVVNLLLGLVVLSAGPWLAVHFYRTPSLSPHLKLFAVIMILGAFTTFFGKVLQGYRNVARLALITDFIGAPLTMLVAIALITVGAGLGGYIFAQIVSAAVVVVLLVAMVWRVTPAAVKHLKSTVRPPQREVLAFSTTVSGIGLLTFLIGQSDRVLIGHFLNARQLGVYAVSAAVVAYVPIALQSVNQVFSPTITDLHARGETELLGRVYQSLTKWVVVFTMPLALVLITFAKPLMRIFGPDFEPGWIVLVIGTLGQLVNCGVGSAGYLLLMSGHERRLIKVQVVATAVTVGLGVFLVPRWGIAGAAFATCITTILTNSWNLAQVRGILGLFPYSRESFLRLILPTLGTTVAVLSCRIVFLKFGPVWVGISASMFVSYAAFLGISFLSGLGEDDLLIGRAVWSKIRGMLPVAGIGEE